MKRALFVIAALLIQGASFAQTSQQAAPRDLSYSYGELRFVDVDSNGGDGFRLGGSIELNGPWILLGSFTALDFNNNVDYSLLKLGGGYVWDYTGNFDLFGTVSMVRAEVDTPGGSADDTGIALAAGTRGMLTPQVEIRGSVNHINLDDSDTYLELAGDYYFTAQFSAGISLEFAGDTDNLTIGARWFFR